jgi:hypothetical protein
MLHVRSMAAPPRKRKEGTKSEARKRVEQRPAQLNPSLVLALEAPPPFIEVNAPSKTNAANNGVDVDGGSGIVSFSRVRNVMQKNKVKNNLNKCSAPLP